MVISNRRNDESKAICQLPVQIVSNSWSGKIYDHYPVNWSVSKLVHREPLGNGGEGGAAKKIGRKDEIRNQIEEEENEPKWSK